MDVKKLFRVLAAPFVLAGVLTLAIVVPAFADECWDDFNLDDCATGYFDYPPTIDVTQDVANDIDSGVGGNYWAFDDYERILQAWEIEEDPLFVAVVQYNGAFTTIAGTSPNATGLVGEGVTGNLQGGYLALVYGEWLEETSWPLTGYVGLFDYQGDPSTGQIPGAVSWPNQYFEYWEFEYIWWGWQYLPVCESNGYWVNSQDGNEGDITGEADFSCLPPPAPGPTPLVMMYVYYSPTGFFGGEGPGATNTLTIWSANGPPEPERVAFWAGGSLPEDSSKECSAILWDDGASGTFACDDFLSSVGERRALLRDDPEGRDILEPILRYLSWAAPE